mgnify:CR=1 FL=1
MKRTVNKILHGTGVLFFMVGFIICLGAAGNSDLEMPMDDVVRYALAGLTACVGGAFLAWWKI